MIQKLEPIQVPQGIRYLGNWNEFKFNKFPDRCILDKELPGCGFTQYCLLGDEDVILTSPRIMLINNKADQIGKDVFLVVNEMDKDPGVDKDLNKQTRDLSKKKTEDEQKEEQRQIQEKNSRAYEKIKKEFNTYLYEVVCLQNKPIKILVTYDSYHIIQDLFREFNEQRFEDSYTIVDEFQSILHDARFKSSTEMQFLETLKQTRHVMFASATPMMEEYINMLDEFDGLPFISLDWHTQDPTRIIKPDLDVYVMRSVGEKAYQVIKTYLDGNFESIVVMRNGIPTEVKSTEAVLYVNSVNHIITIIKKMELRPDQVLILCSNTDDNASKIRRRLGKSYEIGHVPNPDKGETFPMFTFCTRTVYLGADFYSTCARTFIFSDANIDSLAVDISEDLPQILGRQRLTENPWKNSATFFYRSTANYRNMKEKDFNAEIERKMNKTKSLLSLYEKGDNSEKYSLADNCQKVAKSYNYKDDYVGVNMIYNKLDDGRVIKILKPKMNQLVYVNELRAFRIQQIDYKDRFTVFATIRKNLTPDDIVNVEVSNFLRIYETKTTMYDKLKLLCEYDMSNKAKDIILSQISDSDEIKSYYQVLGPDRLHKLGYSVTLIKKELGIATFSPELLISTIYRNFNVGDKILFTDLKEKLSNLYASINYNVNAKATDIFNYFEAKEYMTSIEVDGKKKRVRGYKLLSSYEQSFWDKLKEMKKLD